MVQAKIPFRTDAIEKRKWALGADSSIGNAMSALRGTWGAV